MRGGQARNKRLKNQSRIRIGVQITFLLLVICIGIQFHLFVSSIESGVLPEFERPPGVEAFLPISALVSAKHFLYTGTVNNVHPAGLVLFFIICFTALITKRGFCSWVCPIGLLTEHVNKLHCKIFNRRLSPPSWIDYPMRSVKYLLAGFFLYQIFFRMPVQSIERFIQSPYNRFADIKMLAFFTDMSSTAFMVLLSLLALSILIHNFWCRYLCPYGALLGVISFAGAGKIKRNPSRCVDCGKCENHCPGLIKIRRKKKIHSPECSACLSCVNNCPENDVLGFSFPFFEKSAPPAVFAIVFLVLFMTGISTARLYGVWRNDIPKKAYLGYVQQQNHVQLRKKRRIDPEKLKKMKEMIRRMQRQKSKNSNSQLP